MQSGSALGGHTDISDRLIHSVNAVTELLKANTELRD